MHISKYIIILLLIYTHIYWRGRDIQFMTLVILFASFNYYFTDENVNCYYSRTYLTIVTVYCGLESTRRVSYYWPRWKMLVSSFALGMISMSHYRIINVNAKPKKSILIIITVRGYKYSFQSQRSVGYRHTNTLTPSTWITALD